MKNRIAKLVTPVALLARLTIASSAAALPDLVPEISSPSIRVSNVGSGDVAEGCAGGTTNRRLVRYTVVTRNIGSTDLIIGNPGCPNCATNPGAACSNPLYVCSIAHGHPHMQSFMHAELRDLDGNLVRAGRKYGFCLGDFICAAPKYNCASQGISAGCGDIYAADTSCQYIDITGVAVPAGTYVLRNTVDPDNVFAESNEGNNVAESLIYIGAPPTCPIYEAADLPKAIQDLGSASSNLTVAAEGEVTNVQVLDLLGNHTFVGDLEFRLRSPSGTLVTILNRVCASMDNFSLTLDDLAETAPPCPPTDGQAHTPANPLSVFNGEPASGTWTLQVFDRAAGNVGTLQGWGLAICTQSTCPVFPSSSVPRLVPNPGSTASTLNVPIAGHVVDVNLVSLTATHASVGDLELHLVSPSGTDVVVLDRVCGNSADLALALDDAAVSPVQCPANSGATYRPSQALSKFAGEEADGIWTLVAIDRVGGQSGTLTGWGLQICTDSACGTYAATNLPLIIPDLGSVQAGVSVPGNAQVADVNVINLAGSHPQLSDLQFRLTSPSGTDVMVATSSCHEAGAFALGLDDSAGSAVPCPPNDGMFHTPSNPLSVFTGEVAKGLWTLTAFDAQSEHWGQLDAFALQVCNDANLPTPTPTRTFLQTPTPTPTVAVQLSLNPAAAVAGGVTCVSTRLDAHGRSVGRTDGELQVGTQLTPIGCQINSIVGAGSAYARTLATMTTSSVAEADVINGGNPLPLPDGILHTCSFGVAAGATGTLSIGHQASASNLLGAALASTALNGTVTITTCGGDCDANGEVEIDDVARCIGRFLGAPPCDVVGGKHCPTADVDHNGTVSIGEVTQCVNQFLAGCS